MEFQKINQQNFIYKTNKRTYNAGIHAANIISNDIDRANATLYNDVQKVLNNGSYYLPNFFCNTTDYQIFDNLKYDMDNYSVGPKTWSKHHKYEDPTFSKQFNEIIDKMAKHFNVHVVQTRLNYYHDNNDWKPFHHDSHAYGDNIKEDFTMGASFGASRSLEFKHESTGKCFSFPQNNGDIFAFNSEINKLFFHGVPKIKKQVGARFSIIAWGKVKQCSPP